MRMYQPAWKAIVFLIVFLIIPLGIFVIGLSNAAAREQEKHYSKLIKQAEIFADVGGRLHGIAFDNQNSMFVGKNGKEILRVSPEGKITPFIVIKEASGYYSDGPGDTFIYDMEFGVDGNLYVAAEDRILKINRLGQVTILLKQDFKGRWGACGIALDSKGNVFVAFDDKILRIQTNGEKSIYIDSQKIGIELDAVVGLEFDTENKHLHICDGRRGETGQLIQIPINTDGSPGKAKVIFRKKSYRPEYLGLDSKNNLVIKGPENSSFVFIKSDLTPLIIELENTDLGEIETIAFGQKGFKRNSIYGTEWSNGKIYRIDF